MPIRNIKLLLLIAGSILFNLIFWNESIGLNVFIFTIFIIACIILVYRESLRSSQVKIVLSAFVLTAVFNVITASSFVFWTYVISFLLLIAFVHHTRLRSVAFAFPASLITYLVLPYHIHTFIKSYNTRNSNFSKVFRFLKIMVVPLILLLIFYFLYVYANPKFEEISDLFLGNFFQIFQNFSFGRMIFFLSGLVIILGLLVRSKAVGYANEESLQSDQLVRIRKAVIKKNGLAGGMKLDLGLKNEYRSAVGFLILINLLLLVVNIIDIKWVWFGFEYTKGFDLKHFVHEATYLLIISILLSIGIMLYYFRLNLNFYRGQKFLKNLAYVWIAQNIVLLLSVFIRNYHYIHYFGLAYKRIGVIIFLILIIIGSYFLFVKIRQNKSAYYLFKTNSWSVYLVLVLASLVDWDLVIARHNLSHPLRYNMETSFLLTMSDKVLPEIDKHEYILLQSTTLNTYRHFPISYEKVFERRVEQFIRRKERETWLSWSYAEAQALEYFSAKSKQNDGL